MAACPNCNADLGDAPRSCAACGWTRTRRRLWIVLGCVFGFLFLVCGGVTTWFALRMKEVAAHMVEVGTPLALVTARAQVVNYARIKGELPPDLVAAAGEPLVNSQGQSVEIRWFEAGSVPKDVWEKPIRYTPREDGTFEIRSSGPDGTMETADDLVEKGSAEEPLEPLVKDLEERALALTRKTVEIFGFDPGGLGVTPSPSAPAPGPATGGE